MQCHLFRLTFKNVTLSAVLASKVFSDANAYAYCLEGLDTPNPHAHIYVTNMKCHATYAKRLSRMGLKGNRDFAFQTFDPASVEAGHPIAYLAYLMKEGNFHSYNISEEALALAKAYDLQKKKEKKSRQKQWEKIMSTIDKTALPSTSNDAYNYILMETIKYYKENLICLKKFNIISTAETITMHLLSNGAEYIFLQYSRD